MNQREAWEALSAAFEQAKTDYYAAEENWGGTDDGVTHILFLQGKFNGLMIARELLAPYLQPK